MTRVHVVSALPKELGFNLLLGRDGTAQQGKESVDGTQHQQRFFGTFGTKNKNPKQVGRILNISTLSIQLGTARVVAAMNVVFSSIHD